MGASKSKQKKSVKENKEVIATDSTNRTRKYSETTHTTNYTSIITTQTNFIRAGSTRTSSNARSNLSPLPITRSLTGPIIRSPIPPPNVHVRGPWATTPANNTWQKMGTSFMDLPASSRSQPTTSFTFDAKPFQPQNDLAMPQATYVLEEMTKPMQITIKKNFRFHDRYAKLPTYNTSGRKRGMALIINNVNFKDNPEMTRSGAEVDEKNLNALFNALNITPKTMKNLTKTAMEAALAKFAADSQLKTVDMCFVVVMSHGNGDEKKITEVTGTDHKSLDTYNITNQFSNENCKHLKGKPKIFIFQCCRGEHEYQHDSKVIKSVREDMLIAYSTLPGFKSIRHVKHGAYYIQAMCKVFMDHAADHHIVEMLVMIQENLKKLSSAKQTSHYENLSFKNCYLHPM